MLHSVFYKKKKKKSLISEQYLQYLQSYKNSLHNKKLNLSDFIINVYVISGRVFKLSSFIFKILHAKSPKLPNGNSF